MREMKDSGVEWLERVPKTWEIVQLGTILYEHKNKNIGMKSNNLLSLSYGNIVHKDINSSDGLLPESFEGYNVIDDGDIVLRLTDLQNDQRSLRVGLNHEKGIVTSAYVTLRRRNPTMSSQYLYYLIHSYDVRKGFYGMGAGVRQGLNYSGVKKIMLPVPPVEEQETIAEFLEKKQAAVDALISNVQAQIDNLKAYKQSLITEVVTKGLDPTVPMKDSGVEWIGEIPNLWNVAKARRIIASTQNGMTRRDLTESKGQIVLKLKNISADGSIDYSYINRIALSEKELETYSLKDGDFLFVRVNGSKGLVGKCAIFTDNGEITAYNDHIIRVRINTLCNKEYFHYYLLSGAGKTEIELHTSTSAGQYTISGEGLRDIWLVLPPKGIQEALCSFLDEKCSQIDKLIAIKQSKIEKLNEYKKSLIYEYVTGKKEVQ